MTGSPRVGVIGIGNVLMGDDGLGPFLIKILESRYEFPENVVLHDLGTPGLGITAFFADYDAVVVIDAVSVDAPPGQLCLYRKEELVCIPVPHRVSPHDPALVEALLFAEVSGGCPQEVLLVGIVPKSTEMGCVLSQEVRAAVNPAIEAVLAELRRLGAEVRPRPLSAAPSIWWEEKVTSECAPEGASDVPGNPG